MEIFEQPQFPFTCLRDLYIISGVYNRLVFLDSSKTKVCLEFLSHKHFSKIMFIPIAQPLFKTIPKTNLMGS